MTQLQLNIYLNEADRSGDHPLYQVIVGRLLHLELGGATVLRGIMGFGHHARVHRSRLFGVSDDRPIVIIAVDDPARIRAALPELKAMVTEGLITLHEVEVA